MGHREWCLGIGPTHSGSCVATVGRAQEAGRRQTGSTFEAAPSAGQGRLMDTPKALIAWSSGKDSAWALHEARRTGDLDIVGALTTVTETFGRVSMHGVREELLQMQLAAVGLPAIVVHLPFPCPHATYEHKTAAVIAEPKPP